MYRKKICLFIAALCCIFIALPSFAQKFNNCGFDTYYQLRNKEKRSLVSSVRTQSCMGPFTIPVIVHVVHSASITNHDASWTDNNLSEWQVYNYLNMVNGLLATSNPNMNISLIPASHDNTGAPIVPVIWHANNTYSVLDINDAVNEDEDMKNQYNSQAGSLLPTTQYLHIWVVDNIINTSQFNNGTDIAGFASFPDENGLATDGIVIENSFFIDPTVAGNQALVLAHELGHYLNLFHTFEGGCNSLDQCADTPPDNDQVGSGSSCVPINSCHLPSETPDENDLADNIMDYSGSIQCLKHFTDCQYTRMCNTLCTIRTGLNNSPGLLSNCTGPVNAFQFEVTNISCGGSILASSIPALPAGYSINWFLDGLPLMLNPNNTFTISTPGDHILTGELLNGVQDCRRVFSFPFKIGIPLDMDFTFDYSPNPLQNQSVTTFSIKDPQPGVQYAWEIQGQSYSGTSVSHTVIGSGCINITITAVKGDCKFSRSFTTACSCPSNIGFESGNPDGYDLTGNAANVSIMTGTQNDPVLGTVTPRFGNKYIRIGNDQPSASPFDNDVVKFTYVPTATSDKLIISVLGYVKDGHTYSTVQNPAMFGFDVNVPGNPDFSSADYKRHCNYADFAGVQSLPNINQSFGTGIATQANGIIKLNKWTDYEINLACYVGQPVEVIIYAKDCYEGQHTAKAYFDFSCGDAQVQSIAPFLPDEVSICKGGNAGYHLNRACNFVAVSFDPPNAAIFKSQDDDVVFYPNETTTYTVTYSDGACWSASETITVKIKDISKVINAGEDRSKDVCGSETSYIPGFMDLPPAVIPPGLNYHYEWYDGTATPSNYIPYSNTEDLTYNTPVPLSVFGRTFTRKLVIDSDYDSCYDNLCYFNIRSRFPDYFLISDVDTCENSNTSFSIRYFTLAQPYISYTSFKIIETGNPNVELAYVPNPPQVTDQWNILTFNFPVKINKQYKIIATYTLVSNGVTCSHTGNALPIDVFPRIGSPGTITSPVACYSNPFTAITLTGTPALTLANTTTTNFIYQWQYSVDFQNTWIDVGTPQTSASPFIFNPQAAIPQGATIVIRRKVINPYCDEEKISNIIILRPVYNITNMISCPPDNCAATNNMVTITGNDLVTALNSYGCTGGYYEWYISTDGINYTLMPNSNVKDITVTVNGALFIKRRFVCGNCYDKSSSCFIQLCNMQGGSIPATQTASGNGSLTITSAAEASVTPATSYNCIKWYYATDAAGPFTLISNNTAANTNNLEWVIAAGLPSVFYVKREIENYCYFNNSCRAASNTCTVSAVQFSPGSISAGITGFCSLSGSININNSVSAEIKAKCLITYLWEYNKNNGSWTAALGTNTNSSYAMNIASYAPILANGDILCFRRKATANCDKTVFEDYSNTICLQYCKKQGALSIGYNQYSCSIPYTPAAFTITSNTTNNCSTAPCSVYTSNYQWQVSTNGTVFTNITGATSQSYTAPAFTQYATRYYRLIKTCQRFLCNDTSNTISIMVLNMKQENQGGQIGYNQTLLVNQTPNMIFSTSTHFCNCTTPVFHWLRKTGSGSWVSLAGVTTEYYAPPTSTTATTIQYQRQMICGQEINHYTNIVKLDFVYEGIIGKGVERNRPVKEKETVSVSVVPVPASDMIRLFIATEKPEMVTIQFTDLGGREVLPSMNHLLNSGEAIPVNTSGLRPGIYAVKVLFTSNRRVAISKFVIVR